MAATAPQSFRVKAYNAYTSLVGGTLSLIAPRQASRFLYAREMYRSFAAGELRGSDKGWRPRRGSGDAHVKRAYKMVAERCRDQAMNNPLISGAITRICNNAVRGGIPLKFTFKKKDGSLDTEKNKAWGVLYSRWTRYCDSTGHDSRGALQALGLRTMHSDGQYFIHRVYDDSLKGIVPLRLEYIEMDMLDTRVDGKQPNGTIARKGIEYDNFARPVRYHFFENHPEDYLSLGIFGATRIIEAKDIIHVWDRKRISQYSGISWMHAVVLEAFRMDDFRHITQDAARLQSIMVGFLYSNYPDLKLGSPIPAGGQTTPFGSPSSGGDTGAKDAPKDFTPNSIQSLPNGTKMDWTKPTHPGNNYEAFVKDSQRWQSAGFGMSFEAFANNYTDASFASTQAGALEERMSYQGLQQFIEEKENWKIAGWFIEAAFLARLAPKGVSLSDYLRDPLLFHEMAVGRKPGWTGIKQLDEANAARQFIAMGLDTHSNRAAKIGTDFDENIETQMSEEDRLYELAVKRQKRLQLEKENDANTKK